MFNIPVEWPIIHFAISLLGAFLHAVGICLLVALRRSRMRGTQRFYLIHLSLAELFASVNFSLNSLGAIRRKPIAPQNSIVLLVQDVISKLTVFLVWYLIMFTFTIDRFVETKWTFQYRTYWTARRANLLCIAHWIFGFTCGAVATGISVKSGIAIFRTWFMSIIYLALDFIFLAAAISAYAFIFATYKKSVNSQFLRSQTMGHVNTDANKARSTLSVFTGSKFWIATLLIATFILFAVCPDIILGFVLLKNANVMWNSMAMILFNAAITMRVSCFVIDAVIYILLSPKVKDLLLHKFRALRRRKEGEIRLGSKSPRNNINNDNGLHYSTQTVTSEM